MKIDTNEKGEMIFQEVFTPAIFRSGKNEEMILVMRDSGFEIGYNGRVIECKNQQIKIHDLHIDETE